MSQHPRSKGRLFGLGAAAVVAVGVMCVLLLPGKHAAPSAPAPHDPEATPAAAANANGPGADRDTPSRRTPAGDDADGADDARPSRRAEYTAAFDRKIERNRQRIERDCAGNEPFVHALDGFDAVRDRIIASAVATDRGLKTKAEQREFERAQLQEFDAGVCKQLAGQSAPHVCTRHFRSCDDIL